MSANIDKMVDTPLLQSDSMFHNFYAIMSSDTYILTRNTGEAQRYVTKMSVFKATKTSSLEDLNRLNLGWRGNIVLGRWILDISCIQI